MPIALTARSWASVARELDPPFVDELTDRVQHQIRVHRSSAVSDQHGDALYAPRFAGLDDEARLQPRPRADEVMVHRTDGEQ